MKETGREMFFVSSGQKMIGGFCWWNDEVQENHQRKEKRQQEYKEMQHNGRREVPKAKQKVYNEPYERLYIVW